MKRMNDFVSDCPTGSRITGLGWHGTAVASPGCGNNGISSQTMSSAFAAWHDHGIGFWLSENQSWSEGYAQRVAKHYDWQAVVLPVRYDLHNVLELGDLDDAATDVSLSELSGSSMEMLALLVKLRGKVGYDGVECNAPCVFELTNTPDFVSFARAKGYDGMVGYEDGGRARVVCAYEKENLLLHNEGIESGEDLIGTVRHGK